MPDEDGILTDASGQPKNLGEMENADAVGTMGSADCGDMLRMWIKFRDEGGRKVIDQATFAKMKSLRLSPAAYLANNDATAFFAATGDLLLTGPTLTNVNDVRVILVDGA